MLKNFFKNKAQYLLIGSFSCIPKGAHYLYKGAAYLASHSKLWPYLVVPVFLNIILFLLFFWFSVSLISNFLLEQLPQSWWAILLLVVIVIATIGAILFLSAVFFVSIGSVLSAPFYDVLGEKVIRSFGGISPDHPWWKGIRHSATQTISRLWWYLLIQGSLIILFIVPITVGPIAYLTIGFITTAFALSMQFLDAPFNARGWNFSKRRKWCIKHKGYVIGFGSAVFLGLGIPIINVLIPPIAIIGAIIMFNEIDEWSLESSVSNS